MKYRPEIDGLRTVAVLPVILFHAGYELFSGGYVGVDVFFVISGYLITTIIVSDQAQGRFSLARFYERRARRILPALFLVMFCCIPFAVAWFPPDQLNDFGQSLIATSVYLSNVLFFLKTNYFNNFAETEPLLHTWSLAVEEQYYVFFPMLMILCSRLRKSRLALMLAAIALCSLALAEWSSVHAPTSAFYLLHTRAWELLTGALVALHLFHNRPSAGDAAAVGFLREAAAITGLGLILFAIFAYDKRTPFPGLYALAPVIGTALIILFARRESIVGRILGNPVFVGIGLISYSAYLWHQPIFAIARTYYVIPIPQPVYLLLTLAVFPLAYLSWAFVEKPARSAAFTRRNVVVSMSGLTAAFVAIGAVGFLTKGLLEYRLAHVPPELRKYVVDKNVVKDERVSYWKAATEDADKEFPQEKSKRFVLILGDSKSDDLYVTVDRHKDLFGDSIYRRARLDDECMADFVERRRNLDHQIADKDCRREIEALSAKNLLDRADEYILTTIWQKHTYQAAADFARLLASTGKRVSILSNAEFADVTRAALSAAVMEMDESHINHFFFKSINEDRQRTSVAMEEAVKDIKNVRFLEKLDIFCDLPAQECRLFSPDGQPYIYDTGHVTITGADFFANRLRELGWLG